jgi:hypothetical protein
LTENKTRPSNSFAIVFAQLFESFGSPIRKLIGLPYLLEEGFPTELTIKIPVSDIKQALGYFLHAKNCFCGIQDDVNRWESVQLSKELCRVHLGVAGAVSLPACAAQNVQFGIRLRTANFTTYGGCRGEGREWQT